MYINKRGREIDNCVFGKVRNTGRQEFKLVLKKDSKYHKKFQQFCWNNGFYTQFTKNGGERPIYDCMDKESAELFGLA